MTRIEKAVDNLAALLKAGVEWPEATAETAVLFNVTTEALAKAFDELLED
jgi:hypothetical protein